MLSSAFQAICSGGPGEAASGGGSEASSLGRVGLTPMRCLVQLGAVLPGPDHLSTLSDSMAHSLARADARAVRAALLGAARSDLPSLEALHRIEAPVFILAWPEDPAHPLRVANTLAERLPHAELHEAESLEAIREASLHIRDFLANLGQGAAPSGATRA